MKVYSAYPSESPHTLSYIWKSVEGYSSVFSGEAAFGDNFSKRFCVYWGVFFLVIAKFFQFRSSGMGNATIKDAALLRCLGAYVL